MSRRIVMPTLIGLLVVVLVASTGCIRQAGPPVTPKPTEAPTEFWRSSRCVRFSKDISHHGRQSVAGANVKRIANKV